MNEDKKLEAISQIACLLRETTHRFGVMDADTGAIETITSNDLFSPDEHDLVKRKFLHLINSL